MITNVYRHLVLIRPEGVCAGQSCDLGPTEASQSCPVQLAGLPGLPGGASVAVISQAQLQELDRLVAANRDLKLGLEAERKRSRQLLDALTRLRQAVVTDPLTGLYNRRAMDGQMNELLGGRSVGPLSVLMLDIDHFKRINDTYGHLCGDRVLRRVAMILRRCLRAEDSAFRYGGEEFMVLLPNTPLEGAVCVAEAIRDLIEKLCADGMEYGPVHCTVSLGVASRHDHDDCDSLFLRVDRALYEAKNLGRNRVVPESLLA
ncbi:MAG: diguanylate cyclase [Thiobacillus sp.]|nr:diguanylate cyclase [Thiobacillus sp.]